MTTSEDESSAARASAYSQLCGALDRIGFTRTHKLILMLVLFGALFDGIEQFNIGYAAPSLQKLWDLSGVQVGLLSSATFGGVTLGCLVAGILGDMVGRRFTYMYNLVIYTFGALICAFAPSVEILLLGRFIVGVGLGGELNTGITLVSELSPTKNRGSTVASINVASGGVGIFLSAALGWLIIGPLGNFFGGERESWRWLLGVLILPAVLVYFYRIYLPESPRFLVSQGRISDANRVLSHLASGKLNPKGIVTRTFLQLQEGVKLSKEKINLMEIFQGVLLKRTAALWVVCIMAFGVQDTITIFMPTILVAQGYDIVKSVGFSMIINAGGFFGALIASYLGGRARRRIVLGYCAVVALALGLVFPHSTSAGMVLALGALLQLLFMLINSTAFIWAPELYPTRIRSFGTGAAVMIASLSGTLTPFVAGAAMDHFGSQGIFVLTAIMFAIMVIATWFGYETFGQTLESASESGISKDVTPVTANATSLARE